MGALNNQIIAIMYSRFPQESKLSWHSKAYCIFRRYSLLEAVEVPVSHTLSADSPGTTVSRYEMSHNFLLSIKSIFTTFLSVDRSLKTVFDDRLLCDLRSVSQKQEISDTATANAVFLTCSLRKPFSREYTIHPKVLDAKPRKITAHPSKRHKCETQFSFLN